MALVSATTWVDAPPGAVFEYMDVPEHQADITPSLTRSTTVERFDDGRKRAAYTYRILGVEFEGEVVGRDRRPGERVLFDMTGDLTGQIEWRFAAADGGTRVSYSADYDLPVPRAVEWLVRPVVAWYNRRELRRTLANLRRAVAERAGCGVPDRTAGDEPPGYSP